MEFNYTTEQTKDCILYSENQLRDLISAILTRKYSTTWENDPNIGWSKEKKGTLEGRMLDKKKKFPNETMSNRLVDYGYVLDLKYLVLKSRDLFEPIFSPWERMMAMFDILGELRNRFMHPDPVPIHLQHLALGICGEFLLAIEKWQKGFSRNIEFYECDLRFVEMEKSAPEVAKDKCLEKANNWIDAVKQLSISEITIEKDQQYNQLYSLNLREGLVKIACPQVSRLSFFEGYAQGSNIHIITGRVEALNQVLRKGSHPYWTLHWNLSNQIDKSLLNSIMKQTTWIKPSGDHYYIYDDDTKKIRIDMYGTGKDQTKIILVYDGGRPNEGFSKAHEVFTPDIVLAILYGEIAKHKVHEIVEQAIQP